MKLFTVYIASVFTLFTFNPIPLQAAAEAIPMSLDSGKTVGFAEAKALLVRLDEISSMDKTALTRTELRQLRKEAREIKGQLKELDGGVYLSVGALTIILLVPWIVFTLIRSPDNS